ncbi:MAG: hypothetical protein ACOC3W_00895 [Thermodesulfobacteriota bacterium]
MGGGGFTGERGSDGRADFGSGGKNRERAFIGQGVHVCGEGALIGGFAPVELEPEGKPWTQPGAGYAPFGNPLFWRWP